MYGPLVAVTTRRISLTWARRAEVTSDRLVGVIEKVRGGQAEMPPDLLAALLGQVGKLQRQILAPRGLRFSGLTEREIQVLRLIADGLDTGEVARQLADNLDAGDMQQLGLLLDGNLRLACQQQRPGEAACGRIGVLGVHFPGDAKLLDELSDTGRR